MADISQTIFSDAFSWMKIFVFWLEFHWRLFLRVPLIIISIGSDNSLALGTVQATNKPLSEPMLTQFFDVYVALCVCVCVCVWCWGGGGGLGGGGELTTFNNTDMTVLRKYITSHYHYNPSARIGLQGYCRRLPAGGRALPHTVTALPSSAVLIGSLSNLVGTNLGAGSRTSSLLGDVAR